MGGVTQECLRRNVLFPGLATVELGGLAGDSNMNGNSRGVP